MAPAIPSSTATLFMVKVSVFYPNRPGSYFDMSYYCSKHIPMVQRLPWLNSLETSLSKIGRCETPSSSKKCGAAKGLTPVY
jgi:hypothetical protein